MSFSKMKESPKEEVNAIFIILDSLISDKGKEGKCKAFFCSRSQSLTRAHFDGAHKSGYLLFLEPLSIVVYKLLT